MNGPTGPYRVPRREETPTPTFTENIASALARYDLNTTAGIEGAVAELTRAYNEVNAFKYKDEQAWATLAALQNQIAQLNTRRQEVAVKERQAGYAEEMGGIIPGVEEKISELGKIPTTALEQLIESEYQRRLRGEVETVTPEAVGKWQPIIEQMYAPYQKAEEERISQKYTDIGRYYGGGHEKKLRRFGEELLGQKVGAGLSLAERDWARRQQLIESALAGGTGYARETRRRAEQPIQTWLGAVPGLKSQQIAGKYGYEIPSYTFNAPAVPSYEYKPTEWEKWLTPEKITQIGGELLSLL